jgi:hypothetical protein
MSAARAARDHIETDSAVFRVRTKDGLVRLQATVKGSGASTARTLLFPAITPPAALLLARRMIDAVGDAAQPAMALTPARGDRARFSAADIAEMRRLRFGGMKLKAIAARFRCTVSAVAYQTAGLLDPSANNAKRRDARTLDAIVRLRAEGCSVSEIALALNCSESGVRSVLRKHKAGPTRPRPNPGPALQMPLTLRPQVVTDE